MGHAEAAAGVSSLSKVIIAMETGFIPPNINITNLRKDIEAFQNGRIKVSPSLYYIIDYRIAYTYINITSRPIINLPTSLAYLYFQTCLSFITFYRTHSLSLCKKKNCSNEKVVTYLGNYLSRRLVQRGARPREDVLNYYTYVPTLYVGLPTRTYHNNIISIRAHQIRLTSKVDYRP